MQNNINVNQKERHELPRHEVQQVDAIKFLGCLNTDLLLDVPTNLLFLFQVVCSLCGTEQEVSLNILYFITNFDCTKSFSKEVKNVKLFGKTSQK